MGLAAGAVGIQAEDLGEILGMDGDPGGGFGTAAEDGDLDFDAGQHGRVENPAFSGEPGVRPGADVVDSNRRPGVDDAIWSDDRHADLRRRGGGGFGPG